jgi:uncharacterized membrane protein
MGKTRLEAAPVALYGCILLMSAVAYYLLGRILIRDNGPDCALAHAFGRDKKGIVSIVIYLLGIMATLWNAWIAIALYVVVAIMWFVPDRRIEYSLHERRS